MRTKRKGTLITSFETLLKQEKSVWVTSWNKPIPLAFILNLQLRTVQIFLNRKRFYTVEPIENFYKWKAYGYCSKCGVGSCKHLNERRKNGQVRNDVHKTESIHGKPGYKT